MAEKKRVKKVAAAKRPAKAAGAKAAPAKAVAAQAKAAAPRPAGKLWIVPVFMALVLAGVGGFLAWDARYLASLKFDMVRTAHIVPQGHDVGQATALAAAVGDPQGHTFVLEACGVPVRLQRFDRQESADTLVYKPRGKGQDLAGAVDADCDAKGNVYVLLGDGRVQVLDNDLKYERTIATGLAGASALSVNGAGRVYVADQPDNKVVYFEGDGRRSGEFGAPGGSGPSLVNPVLLRVTKDDEVVVVENTPTGLRGRIFAKDLSLRKTFLVDKITYFPPVRMGVNSQLKAFFNDPGGSQGIVCWDLSNGRYFGSAQATKDGVQFIAPGCIGADRFTPDVYVHTVPGLIKCVLPAPGDN